MAPPDDRPNHTPADRGNGTDRDTPPLVINMPVDIRSLTLTTLTVIASILFLHYAAPVLVPIVVAILISYILNPMVDVLERWRIHRAVGAGVAVLLLAATLGGGAYLLSGQALTVIDSVPEAAQRLRERVQPRPGEPEEGALARVQRAAEEIDKAAEEASTTPRAPAGIQSVRVVEPAFRALDYVWSGSRGVLELLGQLTLILFLVYFILVSGDLYKRKLVKLAGPRLTPKKITVQILDEVNLQIGQFIRVQVIVNVIVAVVSAVALWLLGVENYLLWGLLTGVFNSIPYVGPLIVTGGVGVVAFLQFDDVYWTLVICGVIGTITGLEGMLLRPAMLSRASHINPVAIFLSLLVWSWIWGFWGTILAVPMVMMIKAVSDRVDSLRPLGELLGGAEPEPVRAEAPPAQEPGAPATAGQ